MKKFGFILAALLPLVLASCNDKPGPEPIPDVPVNIIIDTDFQEGYDNFALSMLLKSKNVKVLGITTTSGNSWAPEAAAGVIRHLEILGVKDVPVAIGQSKPLRDGRLDTFLDELKKHPGYLGGNHGCLDTPEIKDWHSDYVSRYGGEPSLSVLSSDASDFIINTVNSHKGNIVLVSMGPATNIARAVIKDIDLPKKVSGVVLTSGMFSGVGDATEAAEFNALWDPDATKLCYESEFPVETVVSLDAVSLLGMNEGTFNNLVGKIADAKLIDILNNSKAKKTFDANPAATLYPKSLVAAACVLNGGFVTKTNICTLAVNDVTDSDEYGKTTIESVSDNSRSVLLAGVTAGTFWSIVSNGI